MSMINPVTAWSYSRIKLYEQCPLQFKYKHIDKLPEEASPAMERGKTIHTQAAEYISSVSQNMPPSLLKFERQIVELREIDDDYTVVEQQWAFDAEWNPTEWFAENTRLRVILDVGVIYPDATADVIDHKTGRRYADNADQMRLFAAATFAMYSTLKHVTTRLWYFDSGEEVIDEFDVSEHAGLMAEWDKRAEPLLTDTEFVATPNDKCKWCTWRRSNSGPCKFG
jgi:RecB family exonuclease